MSVISETCNHAHDILELVDILPNVSFNKWNGTWLKILISNTNKNGKELPNDVRLKKISELHRIIVQCPVLFPNWKYCQY